MHFTAVSKPEPDDSAERGYSDPYSNQTSSSIIYPYAYCGVNLNAYTNFKTATVTNIADSKFTVLYWPLRWQQELERISRSVVP